MVGAHGGDGRAVTDHPEDAPRLTGEQLASIATYVAEMEATLLDVYDGDPPPEDDDIGSDDWRRLAMPRKWARSIVAELRAARALLADLKAEGCPWKFDGCRGCEDRLPHGSDGRHYFEISPPIPWGAHFAGKLRQCVFCGGPEVHALGEEPRYDHRPMEDGQPCLWLRISEA